MKFKFNQMMHFYKFYTFYIGIKVLKLQSEIHHKCYTTIPRRGGESLVVRVSVYISSAMNRPFGG